MENKEKQVNASYPIVTSTKKGKLYLTNNLMKQINMLHSYVGNVEWSGPVFYKVKGGSIANPETIDIEAFAMYPMDIGTAGYTEYEFDVEQTMDMHDYYPEILEKGWDMGHMHTHHNMKAYFSGTDEQELRDNTPQHAYYLSLIVNHAKQYVARLCVMGKRVISGESGVSYKGIDGEDAVNKSDIKQEQDIVYAVDLDVTFDDHCDEFMAQILKIPERKKKKQESLNKEAIQFRKDLGRHPQMDLWGGSEIDSWNKSFSPIELDDSNNIEDKVRDFCYKIISCDPSAEGHFKTLLDKYEMKFIELSESEKQLYEQQLDQVFESIYHTIFDKEGWDNFYENLTAIMDFLYEYQNSYTIIDFLIQWLNMYELEELEKQIK